MATTLALRDVQLPNSPSWWPPAPGWWCVALALLFVAIAGWAWWWRSRRQRLAWERLFDSAMSQAPSPVAQLAVASELLRRASPVDAQALGGQAWLAFLDDGRGLGFVDGHGRLLVDGGFRRDVESEPARRACVMARARYLELMAARP